MMSKRLLVLTAAVLVLALISGFAFAAGPLYEGKTIRIVVGFAAGGGFDLYARALARHMGRHIPGTPAVIVDNMPGAGSIIAGNYLYKIAKPDGLTLCHLDAGIFLSQLLEEKGIEFEARKFVFIGSMTKSNAVCVLNKARGIASIKEWEASKTPVKLGGVGTGHALDSQVRILQKLIGLPIQLISPYKGQSDLRLAMEKREIDGTFWPYDSLQVMARKAVEAGDFIIVLQAFAKPLPSISNVPLWMNLAKAAETRQIIELFNVVNDVGRPFFLPPGTPNDHVQTLRKAFQETLKDKEFLAEAEKAQMGLDPSTGEELEMNVNGIFKAVDPAQIPKLKEVMFK